MWISNGPVSTIKRTVGTGGTAAGSLCVMSSNTAVKAANAASDATIFGIACAAYDSGDVGDFFEVNEDTMIASKYTGSSKTSLTDADLGKVFDLSSDVLVDLDDTSGGCASCEGYDNDNDLIFFKVVSAKLV